jgi:hypothetical protein
MGHFGGSVHGNNSLSANATLVRLRGEFSQRVDASQGTDVGGGFGSEKSNLRDPYQGSERQRPIRVLVYTSAGSSGDEGITAWQMKLADKQHKIYGNVLIASPDPTQDRTQVGWLDPGKLAKIALTTERVVRVDNFYCVFQVTGSHFVAPGQPYLDHMTLEIRVTNTMPHSEIRARKEDKAPS